MAQIRVERGRRISPWVWLIAALAVVVVAVVLLDYAGYIRLPVRLGMDAGTMLLAGCPGVFWKGKGDHGKQA
jgi:hypothetical protein